MGYRQAALFFAAFGLAAVGGCGAIGQGTTETTRFYVLHSAIRPAAVGDRLSGPADLTAAVGPVTVASYLKRPHIVTVGEGNEVHLADFDRWAEDIEEGVARVLSENLAVFLGTDRVIAEIPRGSGEALYGVKVALIRFDGRLDGSALLAARWDIVDTESGVSLLSKRSFHRRSAEGDGYGALVAAENGALEDFSREIADALSRIHRERFPDGRGR